jgi:hyperosmotically inducible periplasmic protein
MMRRHESFGLGVFGSTVLAVAAALSGVALAQQASAGDAQAKAEIERRIEDLKLGASRVTVAVHDHVVTLDGTVPSLWLKREVIDRAHTTKGIVEVDSTIEIARAENDATLADEVGKRLREYPHYTIYDFVDGRVRDGVVTLAGAVMTVNKQAEITELIEKIHGVRDLKNGLTLLPASSSDDRIRRTIANQIYGDPLFINYSSANPPIHVIVEYGHVTLFGIVSDQLERQKAEVVARMVSGVFSVDDRIQLTSELRGR